PENRANLLNVFRKYLKPGGSLLVDVLSHLHFDSVIEEAKVEHADKGGFWSGQAHVRFENTYKYNSEKVYLSKHSIVEESSTRDFYNWMQCYNPETLQNEFMANGLRIKEFYSDAAGANYNCETSQFAVSAEIL
nr:class I SAM-dependent methyltransferase [Candidatus Kapabacteria bacterium]